MFRDAVRDFSSACDHVVADNVDFPGRFRVKSMEGAPGILEMIWSFSGPDGRATWTWTTVIVGGASQPAVMWRRVGSHRNSARP